MINLAEHRSGLWGDPPVRSGPKTDNEKLAAAMIRGHDAWCRDRSTSRVEAPIPTGHNDHREVRHGRGVDVSHREDALLAGAGAFDVPGVAESARLPQRLDHPAEGPTQFHDRCRVRIGEPTGELRYRQSSG